MESYYERNKEKRKRYQKQYRQEHKDESRRYQKQYYREHKDESRRYYQERKKERRYKKQGDFLKEKLKELNKNQSWLARELGVTKESVSKYIRGIYFPKKIEKRKELCRILRIKYSDLEKMLERD